jgi:hypothetical protein
VPPGRNRPRDLFRIDLRSDGRREIAVEWILRQIFKQISTGQNTSLRVVFADDGTYSNRDGEPDITIKFHTRAAEWRSLLLGYVGMFEAYFDGRSISPGTALWHG